MVIHYQCPGVKELPSHLRIEFLGSYLPEKAALRRFILLITPRQEDITRLSDWRVYVGGESQCEMKELHVTGIGHPPEGRIFETEEGKLILPAYGENKLPSFDSNQINAIYGW